MVFNAAGLNAICYNCAVSDFSGYVDMICEKVNGSQSSSLLVPKEHLNEYPFIKFDHKENVYVERLENLDFDRTKYNILVMDLQGNELQALKGSGNLLDHIDCIYTEVNFREMYKECVLIDELDSYLTGFGFSRVETGEDYNNQGWSDAFYIKK
jgi:FkbM family methyltransferase